MQWLWEVCFPPVYKILNSTRKNVLSWFKVICTFVSVATLRLCILVFLFRIVCFWDYWLNNHFSICATAGCANLEFFSLRFIWSSRVEGWRIGLSWKGCPQGLISVLLKQLTFFNFICYAGLLCCSLMCCLIDNTLLAIEIYMTSGKLKFYGLAIITVHKPFRPLISS